MKKKHLLVAVPVAVVLLVLALPLLNLVLKPAASTALSDAKKDDPLYTRVAEALQTKCGSCHIPGAKLPFYAGFPIASSTIRQDVDAGLAEFDLVAGLVPAAGQPATEPALAKLEYTVSRATMPPGRFLALHWDGGLSAAQRADVLAWVKEVRKRHYATPGLPDTVQEGAIRPLPASVPADAAKVALGKQLYHDKRLSGDDTLSCASCHDLAKGGTDRDRFSTGIRGQKGDINSPTTYNSGFQFVQFWDGRAATLQDQAAGPVANPVEMGAEWPKVVEKLKADEAFAKTFAAAYPAGLTAENVQNAIAEFERTLVTPNAAFDKFLAGDAKALSAEEKQGYDLFVDHACATCHAGKLLGGASFEKMGVRRDYFAARGGPKGKADDGRFSVTKKESDRHRFKVPTLRNVALTGPWFHDGTVTDLCEAVKTMAKVQRDDTLTDAEAGLVVKFLGTLTGEYEGKRLQ
jgi:cytochrome c peroxidase